MDMIPKASAMNEKIDKLYFMKTFLILSFKDKIQPNLKMDKGLE